MESSNFTKFIQETTGESHLRVQDDLGDGFVRLRAAEAQRRQAKQDIRTFEDVVIEMLRNARDAGAAIIFVATWTEGSKRRMTMLDNGSGIPASMHETVFEPFVTSKLDSFHSDRWGVHGRGMALYSIRENVEEARIVESAPGLGSVFSVQSSMDALSEKRDQSTPPAITQSESGTMVLKGPHNIIRTVMEFAIDERGSIAVYLGSCAEIVATLVTFASGVVSRVDSIFSTYSESTPFIQRFAFVEDPASLAALANALSLPISERTARRILNGEIKPLATHLETLLSPSNAKEGAACPGGKHEASSHPSTKPAHRIKFQQEDLDQFALQLRKAYEPLAEAYYLNHQVEPQISTSKEYITVKIPLDGAQ